MINVLPMNTRLNALIGEVIIKKDGVQVYHAPVELIQQNGIPTLRKYENLAKKDPNASWECIFKLPHGILTYTRQRVNSWKLTDIKN